MAPLFLTAVGSSSSSNTGYYEVQDVFLLRVIEWPGRCKSLLFGYCGGFSGTSVQTTGELNDLHKS